MAAIHFIHDSFLTKQTRISNFVITEDLLISYNRASNKYKAHLLGKSTDAGETEKSRNRKALQDELTVAKKRT